jgi:RimJ/RimL family protein N-acetyltransferase
MSAAKDYIAEEIRHGESISLQLIQYIARIELAWKSILAGNTEGRIWRFFDRIAGSSDRATVGEILWDQGNNVFFISTDDTGFVDNYLAAFIDETLKPALYSSRAPFCAVSYLPPVGSESIQAASNTDRIRQAVYDVFSRYRVRDLQKRLYTLPSGSDGYCDPSSSPSHTTIVSIDRHLLESSSIEGVRPVRQEIEWMWPFLERYYENGFGFATITDDRIACWCTSEYVSQDTCGIGIETAEEFRRRGYAYAAAGRFLNECRSRKITPHWECDTENVPSIRLAEKLGLKPVETFDAIYCRF